MYKGPVDKGKGGKDEGWEVGVGGVGESSGGKMETTVFRKTKETLVYISISIEKNLSILLLNMSQTIKKHDFFPSNFWITHSLNYSINTYVG